MKSSHMITDFYTNSIGEGPKSLVDKTEKLINNLPKPFVKQNNNVQTMPNEKLEKGSNNSMDIIHRKLLSSAKKGDRDAFLQAVEL